MKLINIVMMVLLLTGAAFGQDAPPVSYGLHLGMDKYTAIEEAITEFGKVEMEKGNFFLWKKQEPLDKGEKFSVEEMTVLGLEMKEDKVHRIVVQDSFVVNETPDSRRSEHVFMEGRKMFEDVCIIVGSYGNWRTVNEEKMAIFYEYIPNPKIKRSIVFVFSFEENKVYRNLGVGLRDSVYYD